MLLRQEPSTVSAARLQKFSLAISSSPDTWNMKGFEVTVKKKLNMTDRQTGFLNEFNNVFRCL